MRTGTNNVLLSQEEFGISNGRVINSLIVNRRDFLLKLPKPLRDTKPLKTALTLDKLGLLERSEYVGIEHRPDGLFGWNMPSDRHGN